MEIRKIIVLIDLRLKLQDLILIPLSLRATEKLFDSTGSLSWASDSSETATTRSITSLHNY